MNMKEKLYQNRDWLYMMYWIKKLSMYQIAKEIGRSCMPIRYWLHKFNIPIRSNQESVRLAKGNHCKVSKEALEWINGELLGDGHLESQSPCSARFQYDSKYLEYAQYVSDTLKFFGIEQCGEINERYYKDMGCYTYHYQSRYYVELLPIRKQWYPNSKKIVPKDIKLTPLTLRQYYIGDGCLAHPQRARPYIILATYGFPISDVEWLVNELNKLDFKATRRNSDNSIHISTFSTQDFLNYIGKCPIECYKYKWR